MVSEAIDAAAESAQQLARGMTTANPFVAFVLIVIVVMLGWFVYSNQLLQDDLIKMKLDDRDNYHASKKHVQVMSDRVADLEDNIKEANDHFNNLFAERSEKEAQQFIEGRGLIATVNEKLDLIISNQQIRGAIQRGQGGAAP